MKTKNIYALPIAKSKIEKIDSKTSPAHIIHKSKTGEVFDLRNAVDILCPTGTPVRAALAGEVIACYNKATKGYAKWKPPAEDEMPEENRDGNYVVIKHANDEFSIYSHLGHNKITVKVGDSVKLGGLLGYVGQTGWSIVPHLHFMVFKFTKPKPARDYKSLRVSWKK